MLGMVAAVLFLIAFLINAAEIGTNDVFSSVNVMLLGLTALALHVAGIGTGRPRRRGPGPTRVRHTCRRARAVLSAAALARAGIAIARRSPQSSVASDGALRA